MQKKSDQLIRRTLINKRIQLSLVAYTVVVIVISTVFSHFNFWVSQQYIATVGEKLALPFWIVVFSAEGLTYVALILFLLVLTNRFVGPIYRTQRYLRENENNLNSLNPLTFRKNDNFSELAEELNKFVAKRVSANHAFDSRTEGNSTESAGSKDENGRE